MAAVLKGISSNPKLLSLAKSTGTKGNVLSQLSNAAPNAAPNAKPNAASDMTSNLTNSISGAIKGIDFSSLFESREYFAITYKFKKEIKAIFKRVKEKTCGVMNTPEFHKAIQESIITVIEYHINSNAHFFIKEEKKEENATEVVEKEEGFYYQMYAILFSILLEKDNPESHQFVINQLNNLLYEIEMDVSREEKKEEIDDKELLKMFRRKEWLDTFIQNVILPKDVFIYALLNSNKFLEIMGKNPDFLKNMVENTNGIGLGNEFTDQMVKFAITSDENKKLFQLFVDKLVSLSATEGIDITDFKEDEMSEEYYENNGGGFSMPKTMPNFNAMSKSFSSSINKFSKGMSKGTNMADNKKSDSSNKGLSGAMDLFKGGPGGPGDTGEKKDESTTPVPSSVGDSNFKVKLPESSSYFSLSRIRKEIRDTLRKIREKICEFMSQKKFHNSLQDSIFNDIEKNIKMHSNFFTLLDESNQNGIVIHNSFFYQLYTILFNILLKYENYDVHNYVTEHCAGIVRHLKENVDKSDLEISKKEKELIESQKKWVDVFIEKVILPSELFTNELLKKEQVCSVLFHQASFLNYALQGNFLSNLVFFWTSEQYNSHHDRIEEEKQISEDADAIEEEGIENSLEKRKLDTIAKEKKEKLRIKRAKFQNFVRILKKKVDSMDITGGGEDSDETKDSEASPPEAKLEAQPETQQKTNTSNTKSPPPSISNKEASNPINSIDIPKKQEKVDFTSSEIGAFNPSKGCPDAIVELLGITSQDNNPIIKRIMERAIQDSKIGAQYQRYLLEQITSLGTKSIEDLYEETTAKSFNEIYQDTENFKQNRLNPDSEENQDSFIHSMTQKENKMQLVDYILKIPDNKGYEILVECILTNEKLKNNQLFLFRRLFDKLNVEEMKTFLLNQKIDLDCASIHKKIQKKEQMKEQMKGGIPENAPVKEAKTEPVTEAKTEPVTEAKIAPEKASGQQLGQQLFNSGKNLFQKITEPKKKKIIMADAPCSPEMAEIIQKGVNSANGGPPIDATILKKMITFSVTSQNIESIFEKDVLTKLTITQVELKNRIKRFMVLLLKPNQSAPPAINNEVNIQKKIILLNKIFSRLSNFDSRELILTVFEKLSLQPITTPSGSLFVNIMNRFYKEYENTVKMKNKLNEIIMDIINDNQEIDNSKIQIIKEICSVNSNSIPTNPVKGGFANQKKSMNQTMRAYSGKKKNKTYRKRFRGKRL